MKIAKIVLVQTSIYSKFKLLLQSQKQLLMEKERWGLDWFGLLVPEIFVAFLQLRNKQIKSKLLRDVQNISVLFNVCDTLGTGILRN